jgi:hypothetical protein
MAVMDEFLRLFRMVAPPTHTTPLQYRRGKT